MKIDQLRRNFLSVGIAAPLNVGLFGAAKVNAQNTWPRKPVKLVIGFAPGSVNDAIARLLCQSLTQILGESFVVDNKTGAGGVVGTEAVVRAPADGYTFMLGTSSQLVINVALYKKLNFNITESLVPVALVSKTRLLLTIHPQVPARNLQEFVAYAKAQPGKLNYATSGLGGIAHVATERFIRAAGLSIQAVHYRGAGPALQALMAGECQMLLDTPITSIPLAKSGKMKIIAVSTPRMQAMPEVATFEEQGLQNVDAYTWNSVMAPKETPDFIISLLNNAINKALAIPSVVDQLEKADSQSLRGSTPASTGEFWRKELELWLPTIDKMNISLD